MAEIDWKDLLCRYMRHVCREEGVTFTRHLVAGDDFTAEEVEALKELSGEPS